MNKSAFTLAEVLVTLAIIGAIAAMVIPALSNNISDQKIVSALKKNYSIMSQAQNMLKAKDISLDDATAGDSGGDNNGMMDAFVQVLSVNKVCGKDPGCFPDVDYPHYDGTEYTATSAFYINNATSTDKIILADGSLWNFWDPVDVGCTLSSGGYDNICGTITVDVNGFAKPNKRNRDFFSFVVTRDQILPSGIPGDGQDINDCLSAPSGNSCTYKVLSEGKIDY